MNTFGEVIIYRRHYRMHHYFVIIIFFIALLAVISFSQHLPANLKQPKVVIKKATEEYMIDPDITKVFLENPNLIEDYILEAMKDIVKNPATFAIDIVASDTKSKAEGYLSKVKVFLANGTVDNLVLDDATFEFIEVQLNTTKLYKEKKLDLVKAKQVNMDVIISEKSLNDFLKLKSKKIKVDDPKITLKEDCIELQGTTKYSFMKIKFWATGRFEVIDSQEIWFHVKKLKMNNLSMPKAFIGSIVKKINPILDLRKFPFRLNLKEIYLKPGYIKYTSFRHEPEEK